MNKVRIGVAGLGRLGLHHAKNIHARIPGAELAAVCSIVPAELFRAAEEMQPECVYEHYRDMFQNDSLDAVVIATSSAVHCEMALAAAECGVKNIFIEKPLGMSLQEADSILAAAKEHGVRIFQIGYNRRFDPSYLAMKEKLETGYIGTPVLVKMINRDPASMAEFIIKFSPTSGGLVFDMLTHDYDLARWLLSSKAESVYGLGGVYAYPGLAAVNDIDNCAILSRFANGAMGYFETTRNCPYGYHVETEIFGTEGCLRICVTPTNDRLLYLDKGGVHQTTSQWFFEYWEPTFGSEMTAFVEAVRTGEPSPIAATLTDGYEAVRWALAAKKAVDEETVVAL